MKRTINEHDFVDAFQDTDYQNQFSYEGKVALYEYLKELEDSTGFEMELDMIALCCEYTEYENFYEFRDDYEDYVYKHKIKDIHDIHEHTQVIEFTSSDASRMKSFIIQQF